MRGTEPKYLGIPKENKSLWKKIKTGLCFPFIFLWSKIELPKPDALPMRFFCNSGNYTWEDWREENKVKYPFRYWLTEDLPCWFRVKWMSIDNAWYWLTCHLWRKYHLLDLRTTTYRYGYQDPCQQYELAVLAVLRQFLKEEEHLENLYDNRGHEDPRNKEILEIYNWLSSERNKVLTLIPSFPKNPNSDDKKKYFEIRDKIEKEVEEKDLQCYKRVAELYKHLWT